MINTIGCYYETPFGIVFTYAISAEYISWFKIRKTKRFNNIYQHGCTKKTDTNKWIRKELEDFPDSADPILPYSFDLFFDIKRMSQLRHAFKYQDKNELLNLMKSHGIKFKKNKSKTY
jgi:hypothetical protein